MRTVYFDLETGGLLEHHPIIQLAAVAVDENFKELDAINLRLQFNRGDCDESALEMNSFDADVWQKTAVQPIVAVNEFAEFLRSYTDLPMASKRTGKPYYVAQLAGYNAATFDGPRLSALFREHSQFLPAHPQVLCVLQRAKWYFHELGKCLPSYKLGAVCEHVGIAISEAHDALSDVRATVELAKRLKG